MTHKQTHQTPVHAQSKSSSDLPTLKLTQESKEPTTKLALLYSPNANANLLNLPFPSKLLHIAQQTRVQGERFPDKITTKSKKRRGKKRGDKKKNEIGMSQCEHPSPLPIQNPLPLSPLPPHKPPLINLCLLLSIRLPLPILACSSLLQALQLPKILWGAQARTRDDSVLLHLPCSLLRYSGKKRPNSALF